MNKRAGIGQFFAWDGGCLFIGHHDRVLGVHSHQAMQIMAASEGTHRVRASDDEPWQSYTVAGIPTRQPHTIDVTGSDFGIVVLIEPETREGRAIAQRFLRGGIAEVGSGQVTELARAVFKPWLAGDREGTVAATRALVRGIAGDVEPQEATDERILKAVTFINSRLSNPITLDEVANHACLSPSRFRHLFSEQVGMGLRPYILWRRFILVWELGMYGKSLSEAAHAAGFADAAHLSRTSVRNFGFAPSGIQFVNAPADLKNLPARR
jgi:AraC family transcriptional regulator